MEFKRALLASSALALFAGAQEAQAGDLYLSVFGGANFQPSSSSSFFSGKLASTFTSTATLFEPDTGFVLGGVIGTSLDKWQKGLRAEVEVSYRRNDVGGAFSLAFGGEAADGAGGGVVDANNSNFAILANLWYDIDIGNKVRPYVGGGVGWARARRDGAVTVQWTTNGGGEGGGSFTTVGQFREEHNGFAWQLGAGFNYEVSPGVDVGLGYRYFNGPKFSALTTGGEIGGEIGIPSDDNESHSVQASITIKVD